jgi:hypothetical protein
VGATIVSQTNKNVSEIGLRTLLAPLTGLGTAGQYIRQAHNFAEQRKRAAIIATIFSASISTAQINPEASWSMSMVIVSLINHMQESLYANTTLAFFNPVLLARCSRNEIVFLKKTMGGILLVFIFLPKVAKIYFSVARHLSNKILDAIYNENVEPVNSI